MRPNYIGSVNRGLFNLYAADGTSINDVGDAARKLLFSEARRGPINAVRSWMAARALARSVVVAYGPAYEEGDNTGPIPSGVALAAEVDTILQNHEGV